MLDNGLMTEDFSPKKQLETQKGGAGRKGKTAIGSGDDGDADYQSWSARERDPAAMRRPITVICDGNLLIRFGLGLMLEPVAQVVGDAACGKSALELVSRVRPQLVILDVNLPVLNGVHVCSKILQDLPETRLVAFSDSYFLSSYHQLLVRAGVSAFCLKSSEPRILMETVQHAIVNQPYCDARLAKLLNQDPTILLLDEELSETEIERVGITEDETIAEKHAKEAIERWLKHNRS